MSKIFAYVPSSYKLEKTYTAIPNDGTADFTFSRPSPANRTDPDSVIESMAIDVPRIDYSDEGCPKLLLDNSISEKCFGSAIDVSGDFVWTIELSARENGNTIRRVQMSDATDNYVTFYYGSSSNSIGVSFFDGTNTVALSYNYSDNTLFKELKVVKTGTEISFKIDGVLVGYSESTIAINTLTQMDYSAKNTGFYMDGKTRKNTIDNDATTFNSTAKSYSEIDSIINNYTTR